VFRPPGFLLERGITLCIAMATTEAEMFFNPMLPFIIYLRWLETVVLPYLDSFESKYARYEQEELQPKDIRASK